MLEGQTAVETYLAETAATNHILEREAVLVYRFYNLLIFKN